jgi:hypothetical protein
MSFFDLDNKEIIFLIQIARGINYQDQQRKLFNDNIG